MNEVGSTWIFVIGFCQLVILPGMFYIVQTQRATSNATREVITKVDELFRELHTVSGGVKGVEEWRRGFVFLVEERHKSAEIVHDLLKRDLERNRDSIHNLVNQFASIGIKARLKEMREEAI